MPKRESKGKSLIDFPMNFTVIDIETTGLDPSFDSIIEIAALRVRDGEVVDNISSLIKPDSYYLFCEDGISDDDFLYIDGEYIRYIDPFIERLTGITNEMLHEAPNVDEVLNEIMSFVGDDIVIGHNVNFDINFLYDNALECFKRPVGNDFVDTMRLSRHLLKELPHHRLKDISSFYEIDYSGAHRSMADCLITFGCYQALEKTATEKYGSVEAFIKETKKKYRKRLKAPDIVATVDHFDETHPFFGQVIVFTGTLERMTRKEAMQHVANVGGTNGNSVTKKTNYLVIGNYDYCKSIKDGKSTKQKKAEKLILEGQNLKVISESVCMTYWRVSKNSLLTIK